MSIDGVKLLGEIKDRSVEAAVFGSFNVSFPFFEQVIQPALRGKGCHHQILLMDAAKCGDVAGDAELSPQRAGMDYCLVPVRAPRSFHPKFMLLLGRIQSRVLVGSHNLTLSGFGLNREVTNRIVVKPSDGSQALAAAVFQFARSWTAVAAPELVELVDVCAARAPWITAPAGTPADCAVLGTLPEGPSLWERLRGHINADVARVTVLGPYFDSELRFLKVLAETLAPSDFVVAVSPEHSEIPANAERLVPAARWVDLTGWGDGSDRLVHAKLLLVELRDGTSVLVSGSANPSAPAWLGEPAERNAELVVVRHLASGDPLPPALGLTALSGLPSMTPAAWGQVAARESPSSSPGGSARVWAAIEDVAGFRVPAAFVGGAQEVSVCKAGGVELGRVPARTSVDSAVLIPVSDTEMRQSAAMLSVEGGARLALVQHLPALRELATDEKVRSLRSALLDLSTAEGGLDRLIATVEKAIFDGVVQPFGRKGAGSEVQEPGSEGASGAAVSVGPLPVTARKHVRIAAGDLAMILDALIHRLGEGLLPAQDTVGPTTSEEDLTETTPLPSGKDDDSADRINGAALAAVCQRKTRTLMQRMLKRLNGAKDSGDCAQAVVQLAATLALVRQLRAREATLAWLPRGLELVDGDTQWAFFKAAANLMYAPGGVAEAGVAEVGKQFGELEDCAALLAWSAFRCGLDGRTALTPEADPNDQQGQAQVEDNLVGVAMLLQCLAQPMPDAEDLRPLFGDAGLAWLDRHVGWVRRHTPELAAPKMAGVPGMAVRWPMGPTPKMSVVVSVDGDKSRVVDLTGAAGGERGRPASRAGVVGSPGTRAFKSSYLKAVGMVTT